MEGDEEDGTLGSCGCVDYHMADCPTRTAGIEDYYREPHDYDPYYDDRP